MKRIQLATAVAAGLLCIEAQAQSYSRTDTIAYEDNTTLWVLGQPQSSANLDTGLVESLTVYDPATALPTASYAFGQRTHTYTWHADGTLASVSDGRDSAMFDTTVHYADWRRGRPQTVRFPDGTTQSAVVDDLGLIRSITDEGGAKTCYAYDVAGRLTGITYPSEAQAGVCDTSAWTPLVANFARSATAAYGLPAGHWQHSVGTGHGIRRVYYDALWRPVLEETYDAQDRDGTLRQTLTRYDAAGRAVFQSAPARGLTHVAQAVPGTHLQYDVLGRIVQREQDAELGRLRTTTDYLPDGRVRVTDPGGNATITAFMAFDAPATDWPVAVQQPEGMHTRIDRDVFGKTLAITRSDAAGTTSLTRRYRYDAAQRLCKQVEPETGVTVMQFDAAGNLQWSAAGLAESDPNTCETVAGFDSGRRVDRTYDARGRLTALTFPDGRGNTTHEYAPDGKLQTLIADNGDGTPAIQRYDRNRRGLLVRETLGRDGTIWPIDYSFSPNGHLASQSWHGLSVDYAPNSLGQPTRAGTIAHDVRYHPDGTMAQFTYGNDAVHTLTQNARQLPDARRDVFGATKIIDERYDYDGNANVVSISDGVAPGQRDLTMTYDALDRLKSAASPLFGGTLQYGYDVLDNMVTQRGPDRDLRYCFDASNRLTFVRSHASSCTTGSAIKALTYDVQGNVTQRNATVFALDYGNRLRGTSGDVQSQYAYDGHGRRVWSRVADETVSHYTLDGRLVATAEGETAKLWRYVHLNGRAIARAGKSIVPAIPALSVPGYSTNGGFTVSWTTVGGATTYELEERAEGGAWSVIYSEDERTFAVSGKLGGGWGYRVRACNAAGCGAWSAEAAVFVQVPPAEPSAIVVPAWGPNGAYTVTWEPPLLRDTGSTSYRLEERMGEGAWTSAYEGTALESAFAQRPTGTYAHRVASCNPYGCSVPKEAENTVTVVYPPATPALSVPGPQLTHTYTVGWSSVTGAERYELDEQFNAGEWKRVHTAAATTVTLTGRNVTGIYEYRVRACNLAGCGAFTAVRTVQVTMPPTGAPVLTVPATSYTGAYTIDWNDIAHTTRYELSERRNGGAFAVVHNAAASQAARSGRDQARWEYRVRACNAAGCGPDSAIVGINVYIVPATSRIAWSEKEQHGTGKTAQVSCSVSWTTSANADRYELKVPPTGIVQYSGPQTFISGWGASQYCGASHVVRACNVAGCSAWSDPPFAQTLVMGAGGAGAYSVMEAENIEEGTTDE